MAFGRLGSGGTGFGRLGSTGSGGGVAAAVGGGALLTGEANGFATDFTYATDASRVAVKTAGAVTAYAVDAFYANAGTSPKMVYDSAGVLGWSPHNLLTQSQTFDNAAWSPASVTVVANQAVAPDGTTTMDKIYPTSTGGNRWISNPVITIAIPYTYSVYAKAAGKRWMYFLKFDGSNFGAWFDLQTGVVGDVAAGYTSSIQDVGNGIYRCIMTALGNVSLNDAIGMSDANGGSTITANGTDGIYLWGAQLNRGGSAPTAYLPTTTAARYGLAIDYDPVTHAAKGLLCEPAATNVHTYSNELSTGVTAEGGTVTVNNQTGPDGALTADTFTENTATLNHGGYGSQTITANTDYTYSCFMKMGTRRYASLGWTDGTNGCYAVYDLQTGVVGSSAAIGTGTRNSASIQACPNGWYRCILSGKFPTGTTGYYTKQAANAATITPDGFGRQVFLGTGSTLFVGHAQIEAGTVATSPIPTVAATVTRAADGYNCTATSIGNSGTAGSWWAEVYLLEGAGDRMIIGRNAASVPLFYNSTAFEMVDGTLLYKLGSGVLNNIVKGMSAFQAGDRAITLNGLAPSTDAGATTNLLNPTTIYFGGGVGAPALLGYIRKVRYLPRRPSNAELVTMTGS